MRSGKTLFETALGTTGLAWTETGICGVQLPATSPAETEQMLNQRYPELETTEPTGFARRARDAVSGSLDGKRRDLSKIPLDFGNATEFKQSVYRAALTIPPGTTRTYGELAKAMKKPKALRAVGQALGSNPIPIIVPCHRILAANGGGGFSAPGGVTTKAYLLKLEGADISDLHGFSYDPFDAAEALKNNDKRLGRIIEQVGPPKLELQHTASIFRALARAIIYQQLSGKAAGTIFGRVEDLCTGIGQQLSAEAITALSDESLRGAGLSNNKMLALRDLSARTLRGEVPSLSKLKQLDDEIIIELLTQIRGIGRWTVEMMLIFRLGRGDVMAVDDLGLRQGHARIMGKSGETDRKKLLAYAERWRPYRSLASWYLWRAVDLQRQAKK